MTKKLISCLIALTLILGLAMVSVSADEPKLTIAAGDETVALGNDVTVEIAVTAPAKSIAYFAFDGSWNKSDLTYKSYALKEIEDDTVFNVNEEAGTFEYITLCDNNTKATFSDTVILEITFTAKSEIEGTSYDTSLTITKKSDADEAYVDANLDAIASADVATSNATITLVAAHTAPTVEASITGSGKVGEELAADVKVTDPWGLEADKAYSWKIGSTEVSTADKYTPVPADLGKDITLTVTATVEADDEPTGTGTATIKVIKNDAYKPTVTIDSKDVPEEVKDGADIVIPYAYEDGNGIADATEAKAAYADAADASDWTDLSADDVAVDTENGKVTVKTDKALVDKFVKVTVTPKNVDGDASEAKVLDPIKVIAHEVKVDVDDEDVPDNVKAGSDIVIPYTFSDDNGIADATEVTAKFADSADSSDWTDIPADSITVDPANGTITIKTSKDLAGKVLKVTVTPKNADGDASDPIDLPIIEVKNATRKSSSGGSGASLVAKDETKPVDTTTKTIVLKIGDKTVNVFGKLVENDVAPKIVADRTMMPARIVAESLGAKVDWEDATKKVTITKGSTTIIITIGAETALVNGAEVKLDSPAFIENDRTYTPMRFISENLGAKVDWDDATKTVTITPSDK